MRASKPKGKPKPSWKATSFAVMLCVLGAALIVGSIVIGIHVGWDFFTLIETRRGSQVWAGVPMILFALGGAVSTLAGVKLLDLLKR